MKLRLTLKSFNNDLIVEAMESIAPILAGLNAEVSGGVTLPPEIKRFCVLRSPHIDKDSREHFELRVYKYFFDISFEDPTDINPILKASMPSGISCFLDLKSM